MNLGVRSPKQAVLSLDVPWNEAAKKSPNDKTPRQTVKTRTGPGCGQTRTAPYGQSPKPRETIRGELRHEEVSTDPDERNPKPKGQSQVSHCFSKEVTTLNVQNQGLTITGPNEHCYVGAKMIRGKYSPRLTMTNLGKPCPEQEWQSPGDPRTVMTGRGPNAQNLALTEVILGKQHYGPTATSQVEQGLKRAKAIQIEHARVETKTNQG